MSRTCSRFSDNRTNAGSIQLFKKINTTAAASAANVDQIDSPKLRWISRWMHCVALRLNAPLMEPGRDELRLNFQPPRLIDRWMIQRCVNLAPRLQRPD